jgi:hypothetical protein
MRRARNSGAAAEDKDSLLLVNVSINFWLLKEQRLRALMKNAGAGGVGDL